MNEILFAFLLTLFAGLSTSIGSALAFFAKKTNLKFLSIALGFSAGVMIYVSFVEILQKSFEMIDPWIVILSFSLGMILVAIIDRIIPSFENPHEPHTIEEMDDKLKAIRFRKLHRMGIFTALAIGIHNFPEGIATFISAISDPSLGIAIAVAIAIHNIPEGIAVSVPIYYATGSRKKAFWYSSLSGMAEPVGAIVGYLLLSQFMGDILLGVVFAAVAGIMVFISLDELLPSARDYGEHHLSIYGMILGMMIMAVSLVLFI